MNNYTIEVVAKTLYEVEAKTEVEALKKVNFHLQGFDCFVVENGKPKVINVYELKGEK